MSVMTSLAVLWQTVRVGWDSRLPENWTASPWRCDGVARAQFAQQAFPGREEGRTDERSVRCF